MRNTLGAPLYQQIRADLERRIKSGEITAGQFLPNERVLCQEYAVSRTTVREAVGLLMETGLLKTVRGRGIQVLPQIEQKLNVITPLSELLRQQGFTVGAKILRMTPVVPDALTRAQLQVVGGQVMLLERLHTANGHPVARSITYLPMTVGEHMTPERLNEVVSLYRLMDELGCRISWVEDQFTAREATPSEATSLALRPGQAVLVLERMAYDRRDNPLERTTSVIRSDMFHYRVRTNRE